MKKHEESCNICSKVFLDKNYLTRHKISAHITRGQLNCNECDFQANSEPELKKHLNLKSHKAAGGVIGSELKESQTCNICNEECNVWWILMNHRREVHPERSRQCRNFIKGECNFEDEECWWKHTATVSRDNKPSAQTVKDQDCSV